MMFSSALFGHLAISTDVARCGAHLATNCVGEVIQRLSRSLDLHQNDRALIGMIVPTTHLSTNLRLLCSFKTSIAEVSRVLNVNRSQLNKYLGGTSQPRPYLLRRICDYFGLEVHELLMPSDAFATLLQTRKPVGDQGTQKLLRSIRHLTLNSDPRIRELAGCYHEYYQSMSSPGQILCSLVLFEVQEGLVWYRRIERISEPGGHCRRHFLYEGATWMLGDRIFMADHELGLGIEVTQTILYPDYRKNQIQLHGIKLGVSANRKRTPCAVRVFLERVSQGTALRQMLRHCGLYPVSGHSLPPYIVEAVDNRQSGPHHFEALKED